MEFTTFEEMLQMQKAANAEAAAAGPTAAVTAAHMYARATRTWAALCWQEDFPASSDSPPLIFYVSGLFSLFITFPDRLCYDHIFVSLFCFPDVTLAFAKSDFVLSSHCCYARLEKSTLSAELDFSDWIRVWHRYGHRQSGSFQPERQGF